MRKITLLAVPSQAFAFDVGETRFDVRIFSAGGRMCFDLAIDGEQVLSGCRIVAGEPMIPYNYAAVAGNFALETDGNAEPEWRKFGSSQRLLYRTPDEMRKTLAARREQIAASFDSAPIVRVPPYEGPTMEADFLRNRFFVGPAGRRPTAVQLSGLIDFSRPSEKTYFGPDGLLHTAAPNEWPLEYDPVTLEPLGRSVWEARTNLLTYSEAFDNAVWTKVQTSVASNARRAPDGTITADGLIANVTSATHYVDRVHAGIPPATSYAASVFVERGISQIVYLQAFGTGNAMHAVRLDFATGDATFTTSAEYVSGGGVTTSWGAEYVGNGIWRLWIAGYPDSATTSLRLRVRYTDEIGNHVFAGDGVTVGVYVWGVQLEAGSSPSPYIPTSGSAVTRAADVVSITGDDFSSWFNPEEGTFVVEFEVSEGKPEVSQVVFGVDSGVVSQTLALFNELSSGRVMFRAQNASTYVDANTGALPSGPSGTQRVAFAYDGLTIAASRNGAESSGANVGDAFPNQPLTIARIGNRADDARPLNGHIRYLAYYPKRLSNEQLQALSGGSL